MLILPERGIHRPVRFLQPVHDRDWRTLSEAQVKNGFGHESQTRFTVTARDRPYGRVVWHGWFDDYEDFDNFCWALATGNIRYDRFIQRLADTEGRYPDWHPGLLEDGWWWEYHQWHFLVGPQYPTTTSWTVPSNCRGVSGKSGEFIDCIGGGSNGSATNVGNCASGGGGGAFARITSLELTPGASVTTSIGAGIAGYAYSSGASVQGSTGNSTWFNGASLGAASVGAEGGRQSTFGNDLRGITNNGRASQSVGTTKYDGGSGGMTTTSGITGSGAGGGGAAGPNGAGNNGVSVSAGGQGTAGGSGDAGSGGAAGAGSTSGAAGAAAGAGTEYDGTHGSGGGGGGTWAFFAASTGGTAGLYGSGSGGVYSISTATVAASRDGLIVIKFEPPLGKPIFKRRTRFFTRSF